MHRKVIPHVQLACLFLAKSRQSTRGVCGIQLFIIQYFLSAVLIRPYPGANGVDRDSI